MFWRRDDPFYAFDRFIKANEDGPTMRVIDQAAQLHEQALAADPRTMRTLLWAILRSNPAWESFALNHLSDAPIDPQLSDEEYAELERFVDFDWFDVRQDAGLVLARDARWPNPLLLRLITQEHDDDSGPMVEMYLEAAGLDNRLGPLITAYLRGAGVDAATAEREAARLGDLGRPPTEAELDAATRQQLPGGKGAMERKGYLWVETADERVQVTDRFVLEYQRGNQLYAIRTEPALDFKPIYLSDITRAGSGQALPEAERADVARRVVELLMFSGDPVRVVS